MRTKPPTPFGSAGTQWRREGMMSDQNPHKTSCPYLPELIGSDVPLGMFHCPICGNMVIAGLPHLSDSDVEFMGGCVYEP